MKINSLIINDAIKSIVFQKELLENFIAIFLILIAVLEISILIFETFSKNIFSKLVVYGL